MKHQRKLLINASILGDKLNGVTVYTIETLKRLIPLLEINEIDFIVHSYNTPHLNFIPKEKKALIKLPKLLELLVANKRSLHRLIWNLLFLKKNSKGYDIVYSPSTHGYINGTNQIITIHDVICLNYPKQNKLQYFYFKYIVPYVASKSSIIAISQFTQLEIVNRLKINRNRIVTIYNGTDHIDTDSISLTTDIVSKFGLKPQEYFITVGGNYAHKNIMMLLNVASMFTNDVHKFLIVGCSGLYRVSIQREISERKLNNVILAQYVTNSELYSLYKYCKANIYISLHEGFGFPPIEAAYFEKVSVVSNSSSMPEICGDNVIYVNPTNKDEIVNIIGLFISNKINLEEYKFKLANLRGKYKWGKTAAEILRLIMR